MVWYPNRLSVLPEQLAMYYSKISFSVNSITATVGTTYEAWNEGRDTLPAGRN